MKNISTGFGLCVAAAAALAYPFVVSLAPSANASAVTAAASAVGNAATAQAGPTIVWYGTTLDNSSNSSQPAGINVVRAWSNGRVEICKGYWQWVNNVGPNGNNYCWTWNNVNSPTSNTGISSCNGAQWQVISDPAQGLTYRSDINFDAKVDGADLGQLLADWGDAPRQDIPPADCPLALINP
jgi:hypothetical protein